MTFKHLGHLPYLLALSLTLILPSVPAVDSQVKSASVNYFRLASRPMQKAYARRIISSRGETDVTFEHSRLIKTTK